MRVFQIVDCMSEEDVSFLEESDSQGTEHSVSHVIIFIFFHTTKRMHIQL